jgi:hypothetical protein
MAAGLTKGQIYRGSRRVIAGAAETLSEAGYAFEKGIRVISGEGFEVRPRVLRASNGETAILLDVSGEKAPEIKQALKLWY